MGFTKKDIRSSKIKILPDTENRVCFQEPNKRYASDFFRGACHNLNSFGYILAEETKNYRKYSKDGINFYVPRIQEFFFWVFTDEKDIIFYDKVHYYALTRLTIILKKLNYYKFKKKYFKETGRCS